MRMRRSRTAFSPEHSPSRAQLEQSVRLSLQMPAYTIGPSRAHASRRSGAEVLSMAQRAAAGLARGQRDSRAAAPTCSAGADDKF